MCGKEEEKSWRLYTANNTDVVNDGIGIGPRDFSASGPVGR